MYSSSARLHMLKPSIHVPNNMSNETFIVPLLPPTHADRLHDSIQVSYKVSNEPSVLDMLEASIHVSNEVSNVHPSHSPA